MAEAEVEQEDEEVTFEEFDDKWYPFIAGATIIARDEGLPEHMQPGIEKMQEFCHDWREMFSPANMEIVRDELTRNDNRLGTSYPHDHPLRIRARRALEIIGG